MTQLDHRNSTAPRASVRTTSSAGADRGRDLSGTPRLKILLADVDQSLMETCRQILEGEGHEAEVASEPGRIRTAITRGACDLLFLHERMPGVDTESLLGATSDDPGGGALVIVTSDRACPEACRRALGMGAWDYLPKPFASAQLVAILGRAAYVLEQSRRVRIGAGQDGVLLRNGLTIFGTSPQVRAAVEKTLQVSSTDAPVFLTGESGTGKELFARLIHEHSPRAGESFVPVNCAALPGELLESEMFGHRRGAFTGAVRDKAGILETAHQGTVFLDEIGEMPVTLQAKLLRVVQDGVLRRVGSDGTDRTVDVRIISATNRDPKEALASGQLRDDLMYRLGVVTIHLPPLRERPDDIPVLVRHLTPALWRRFRPRCGPAPVCSDEAMDALLSHHWPGNVRELENVISHAVIFVQPGREIRPKDLPLHEEPGGLSSALAVANGDSREWDEVFELRREYHEAKERMLARFEKAYISRLIARAEGNLCEAARTAGINRTTLYRLMEKHELTREALVEEGVDPAAEGSGDAATAAMAQA